MSRATDKPKVLFVMPLIRSYKGGFHESAKYGEFKYCYPPLGVMTLAGAISPDHQVEIRDENAGYSADFDTDADIVGITGLFLENFHVQRVTELCKYFRDLGKLVCLGGPVATLLSEEMRPYCDVLFEGEGELTWPQFLKDYALGNRKDRYEQVEPFDMQICPIPRIDLIDHSAYAVGSVQTTRGCPFTCEFCDIIVMFGRKVRAKPVENVVKEIELWAEAGMEQIFFTDDNLTGNRPYIKSLLRELIKFNSKRKYPLAFGTQCSIDVAKDTELLELMRDVNFETVFLGIESPRKESLMETHKVQNFHTFDLVEAIHTIQSYGIWVTGGMIIGFDNDDIKIFDEQYDFLQKSGVLFPMVSALRAIPKTPLYKRMQDAGRLTDEQVLTNIKPTCMGYEEMETNYRDLIKRLYTYDAMLERHLATLDSVAGKSLPTHRRRPSLKNLRRAVKTFGYYVLTKDSQRRRFFFKMIGETLKRRPEMWGRTLGMLCFNIHQMNFARRAAESSGPEKAVPQEITRLVAYSSTIGQLKKLDAS